MMKDRRPRRAFSSGIVACLPCKFICKAMIVLLPLCSIQSGMAQAEGPRDHSKRALLIAIDDYANVPDLKGTVNDIERMRSLLTGRFEFPDDSVVLLKNREATRQGILDAIRKHLIEPTRPGDIAVLHYSGHGSQMRDSSNDEIDGWDETLVPHDSRGPGVFDITDDELNALLAELGTKTDNITVVLDSCHSGSATRGASVRKIPRDEREPPPDSNATRSAGEAAENLRPPGANYVLISGARSFELANETKVNGETYGAMTYAFTETLLSSSRALTYRDVMDQVKITVTTKFRLQHPQLEGAGLDSNVFGAKTQLVESYVLVNPHGNNEVRVNAGRIVGLSKSDVLNVYAPNVRDFKNASTIAIVELTHANATTASGKIVNGGPVQELSRATVAEAVMADSKLRVWIDNSEHRAIVRTLIAELQKTSVIEISGERDADIRIVPVTAGFVMQSADGAELSAPVAVTKQNVATLLADQIFDWARWYALMNLKNPNPGVNVGLKVLRADDPKDAQAPERLVDGESFDYSVINNSSKDLYVTVLDLSSDGSIAVLYPPVGAQEVLPPGRTLKERVEVFVPDYRESVVDTVKVIATEVPLDPSLLQQNAVRGGEPRDLPRDPLAEFIAATALGQSRGGKPKPIELDDWTVVQHSLEIVRLEARPITKLDVGAEFNE